MASKLYSMTPKEIVAELDKYIIGQNEARSPLQSPSETDTEEAFSRRK